MECSEQVLTTLLGYFDGACWFGPERIPGLNFQEVDLFSVPQGNPAGRCSEEAGDGFSLIVLFQRNGPGKELGLV
ncbi:MAG: hypothetical protein O3B01_19130 [Planctomycetota bacterium]|nr:hypothetical protein [Planctomycetota bacterium]